jgi:DNA excision repair protein ERCC-4
MAIPHEAEYRPGDEDPEVLRTFTSSRIGGGKNARSEPMKVSLV